MDYKDYIEQAVKAHDHAKNYAEAVKFYTLAIDHYPKKGEQGYDEHELNKLQSDRQRSLYNKYFLEKRYKEAVALCTEEIKKDDRTLFDILVGWNYYRAWGYYSLEQYQEAEEDFSTILKCYDEEIWYDIDGKLCMRYYIENLDVNYVNRALCREKLGRKEEAEKDYIKGFHVLKNEINSFNIEEKRLFKFSAINDNTFKTLINEELFLAQPHKDWNDPYDCNIGAWTDLAKEIFHKYARLQSFVRNKETEPQKSFENMLMWSHYADSHRGICVEYEYNLNFIEKENQVSLHEVKYQNEIEIQFDELNDDFIIKSKVWTYENEARLFYFDEKIDENTKVVKSFKDLGLSIKAVYFGSKCSLDNQKAIQTILQGRGIDFYKMATDAGSFVLGAEKIIQKEALEIEHL
jgi:tetratricopeptide (TPR) repeat protein